MKKKRKTKLEALEKVHISRLICLPTIVKDILLNSYYNQGYKRARKKLAHRGPV